MILWLRDFLPQVGGVPIDDAGHHVDLMGALDETVLLSRIAYESDRHAERLERAKEFHALRRVDSRILIAMQDQRRGAHG